MNKIIKNIFLSQKSKKHILTYEQFMKNPDLQKQVETMSKQLNQNLQQNSEKLQQQLDQKLSNQQKTKINFILEYLQTVTPEEKTYLSFKLKERIMGNTGYNISNFDPNHPDNQILQKNPYSIINQEWDIQETINTSKAVGGGNGGVQQQSQKKVEVEEEIVKEVAEKTNFDLELQVVDASIKIKTIKEVRSILGLGLKEAKDLVEKAPTIIQKDLPKVQAEEIAEKLKAIGAIATLI